jgi:hypothetical protein
MVTAGSEARKPVKSSQVKTSQFFSCIHKQQTTVRKPIECAPEASSGGREWAEMTEALPPEWGLFISHDQNKKKNILILTCGSSGPHPAPRTVPTSSVFSVAAMHASQISLHCNRKR